MTYKVNNLVLVETKSGSVSLKVRGDDGAFKTLHSAYDPGAEARSLAGAFQYDGSGILVVLGLGLGYHLRELLRKYPSSEIIVVEALHEIHEFAKAHGPAVSGNVRYIVGRSSDEALREISGLQIKDGIKPLSVFALSSALSAFPGYYRPILNALDKTVSGGLYSAATGIWHTSVFPRA